MFIRPRKCDRCGHSHVTWGGRKNSMMVNMATPANNGTEISLRGIMDELSNDNYGGTATFSNISLEDCSDGTVATINTNNDSTDRPDTDAPHSMEEFYNYNHDETGGGATSWSNVPDDFTLTTSAAEPVDYSSALSITLTNASGNTTISTAVDSNSVFQFGVAASIVGDPGTGGTSNSGTGYDTGDPAHTLGSASTYYLRFKNGFKASFIGNVANVSITFTNNSVSNTALDISS